MSIYNSLHLKCVHRVGQVAARPQRSADLGCARPFPSISAGAEASYPFAQSRAVSRSLHTLVQANGGARSATSHGPSSLRPASVFSLLFNGVSG